MAVSPNLIPGLRLQKRIGQGASSEVYLAVGDLGPVAVKLLAPHYAENKEVLKRWEREAKTLIGIRHPNLVEGMDYGVAKGRPYFVMEFVRGESLSARLHRLGPLAEAEVFLIARQLLGALMAVHAVGVLHRDVKPANIVRAETGVVKLMDFGLSRHLDDPRITAHGAVLGTPAYVSPEQARGDQTVDLRSDLYSVGVTLFHLVTGEVPFSSLNTSLLLTRKITDDVPDVRRLRPELSPRIAALVRALAARRREDRPPTAKDALAMLDRVEHGDVEDSALHARAHTPRPHRAPEPTPADSPLLRTITNDSELDSAPISLHAGQILFYEDDETADCFVMLRGSLEVLKSGRQVALISEPGSFIGEMSALRKAPRSATVRAVEDSALIRIEEAEFSAFLHRHPALLWNLASTLAERLEQTSTRLVDATAKLTRIQRTMRQLRGDLE